MRGLEHPDPFNFNSISTSEGVRPYGNSVVLNEIHQIFPAFLYDQNQFQNVHDVFNYVNSQMNVHYNVFNAQQTLYRRRVNGNRVNINRVQQNNQFRRNSNDNIWTNTPANRSQRNQPPRRGAAAWHNNGNVQRRANQTNQMPSMQQNQRSASTTPSASPLRVHTDFLANLIAAAIIDPTHNANFNDPVPVVPTNDQLDAGTVSITAIMNLEGACAVCQDSMSSGQTVRRINRCGHAFHTTCIDTWFQRNVHCPVCRHDIREN